MGDTSMSPSCLLATSTNRSAIYGVLVAVLFCACAAPVAALGQAKDSAKTPAKVFKAAETQGEWAAPVNFCTYPCLVGANAAVLNNGSVLFYYYPATGTYNSQAMVLNPITGALTNVA